MPEYVDRNDKAPSYDKLPEEALKQSRIENMVVFSPISCNSVLILIPSDWWRTVIYPFW